MYIKLNRGVYYFSLGHKAFLLYGHIKRSLRLDEELWFRADAKKFNGCLNEKERPPERKPETGGRAVPEQGSIPTGMAH
jgi:hypothetical protein